MKTKDLNVTLHNGIKIPVIGFGTYKIQEGKEVIQSVKDALEIGYRHIDTASFYNNEKGVGEAIRESGIPREKIFITTKIWNSDQGYASTFKAFERSLKNMKLDYLDLYLIHWPKALSKDTWRAMEKLYQDGLIKAIGVSNFHIPHLQELINNCEIKPMVNQVEFHPYLVQPKLLDFCQKERIKYEAWSPLMQGSIGEISLIKELAEKYGKSPAQIVLRWDIQKDVITIPKSTNYNRIKENFEIFDFEMSQDDILKIDALNKNERIGPDPDNFDF